MTPIGTRPLDSGPLTWTPACPRDRMIPGRGAAVLLPTGKQAAVFLLPDGSMHAICIVDPSCGAAVLSRGLVGDRSGEPTVASPLLKQVFSLRTGRCLDDEAPGVRVHALRVVDTGAEERWCRSVHHGQQGRDATDDKSGG